MTDSQAIIDAAREYLGTKFLHQGRSLRGIDCAGLIYLTGKRLGLNIEDSGVYDPIPDPRLIDHVLKTQGVDDSERIGSIGRFWVTRKDRPVHLAFRSPVGLLHVTYQFGVVEHTFTDKWRKRLVSWHRYKGVE